MAKPSKTVLVKVRGDSMLNAGILSGDVAVVETSSQALTGDIVVAEIDGSHPPQPSQEHDRVIEDHMSQPRIKSGLVHLPVWD